MTRSTRVSAAISWVTWRSAKVAERSPTIPVVSGPARSRSADQIRLKFGRVYAPDGAFLRTRTSASVPIELKHLRYAEVAERCGSFRKAADLLSLKQSNLSRRVRRLEDHLGIALFERTSGGVRATAAGRDFFSGVRRVLNELQIVVDGAKAVGRGDAGYLTIGFYTSLSAGNLRASLVEFGRRFPLVGDPGLSRRGSTLRSRWRQTKL